MSLVIIPSLTQFYVNKELISFVNINKNEEMKIKQNFRSSIKSVVVDFMTFLFASSQTFNQDASEARVSIRYIQ